MAIPETEYYCTAKNNADSPKGAAISCQALISREARNRVQSSCQKAVSDPGTQSRQGTILAKKYLIMDPFCDDFSHFTSVYS